jgi:hypothetical protein
MLYWRRDKLTNKPASSHFRHLLIVGHCFAAATDLSSGIENSNNALRFAAQPKISSIRAR